MTLKLSLDIAIFIAMPYVLYQVWAFVAPGLYRHEKRYRIRINDQWRIFPLDCRGTGGR